MTNLRAQRIYCVIGRIATALAVLAVALFTLLHFAEGAERLAASGLPWATIFLGVAVAVEAVGGVLLLIGWLTRRAALFTAVAFAAMLIARLALGTAPGDDPYSYLVRDSAIIASLLLAAGHGAGPFSIDERRRPVTSLGDSNVLG